MDLSIGETRVWLSFRAKFLALTYGSISRSAYEKNFQMTCTGFLALRYHDSDIRIPTKTRLTILYYVIYIVPDMYGYTCIYLYDHIYNAI